MEEETVSTNNLNDLQTISWSSLKQDELLGEGGYGVVHRGQWCGTTVAIKCLYLKTLSQELISTFENEARIMARCHYPTIVRLYGVVIEKNCYALVMEYLSKGSLFHLLHDPQEPLPWNPLRWQIAIDIGKGLVYLHTHQIVHRDLKSPNVLLDSHYQAKIGDFGLAKVKLATSTSTQPKNVMGTTRWRAPELFKRGVNHSPSTDVYSYGMVLWEIATRLLPFADGSDDVTVMGWLKDGEQEKLPMDCPDAYRKLIENCWVQPECRPTSQSLLEQLVQGKPDDMIVTPMITETPRVWQYDDDAIKLVEKSPNKIYQLIPAPEKDIQKAFSFYQHHPMPGYDINSVELIYHPKMKRKFDLYMDELQHRDQKPAFSPNWPQEETDPTKRAWRQNVTDNFQNLAKPYMQTQYPAVKLLPLWHGTDPAILNSIFETGYASLAITDPGWFGKGIYNAHEAEYAYRVYSKGALILNWVAIFSAYPVIDGDKSKFLMINGEGKSTATGNYQNYDAHFVPVVPQDPSNPNESNYIPCKPGQAHKYTEVVVFQSAACLPHYLVTLQPNLIKNPQKPASFEMGLEEYQQGCQLLRHNDYEGAIRAFELAAQNFYPAAYLTLGFLYEEGLTGDKDISKSRANYTLASKSIGWFRTQAETGLPDAQNNLGFCFLYGIGVPEEKAQAVVHFKLAAEQGNMAAQLNLASCYDRGEGLEKDPVLAAKYYELAANQGNMIALHNLGLCYEQAEGVSQDLEKALSCFEGAAEKGHAASQFHLGMWYKLGKRGITQPSKAKAMEYFTLAAAQNYPGANDQLNDLQGAKVSKQNCCLQ